MGEASSAFGMIGTVVGLVAMMANMDDPKAIGRYGAGTSNHLMGLSTGKRYLFARCR